MSYTVKVLPEGPVLLFQAHTDFNPKTETDPSSQDVLATLNTIDQPVFHILDWTHFTPDFADLSQGAAASAFGENAAFHHEMVKEIIFVTQNPMMRMVAENMQTEVYGNLSVRVFETMEEAMDYVCG